MVAPVCPTLVLHISSEMMCSAGLLCLPHCHCHLSPHLIGGMMTHPLQNKTSYLTSLATSSCTLLNHSWHLSTLGHHCSWSPVFDALQPIAVPGKLGSPGLLPIGTASHSLHLLTQTAGYAATGTGPCCHLFLLLDHCATFQHLQFTKHPLT